MALNFGVAIYIVGMLLLKKILVTIVWSSGVDGWWSKTRYPYGFDVASVYASTSHWPSPGYIYYAMVRNCEASRPLHNTTL